MPSTDGTFNPASHCPWLSKLTGRTAAGVPPLAEFVLGKDDQGVDLKVFGGTSGCYFEWDESADRLNVVVTGRTLSGEEHAVDINYTGTLSSGDGMVGLDVAVVTAGTAGAWVSGIYAKVTQGSTKNVNGYISAAEFEVINANDNVSDWFVLVLNSQNNGAQQGSHASYIALRDYGSLELASLFWFADQSAGSDDPNVIFGSLSGDTTASHAIRFIHSGTPYWILCSNNHG